MKSHTTENILPTNPRFHVPLGGGLFRPIRFLFVTRNMCQSIESERQLILDCTAPERRLQQQKLFDRYDPQLSLQAFDDILRIFGVEARR